MRKLPDPGIRQAFAFLLLFATSITHAAAPNAPGVNMRWDQCYGDGGVMNKSFACNTNVGFERLVLSFELAAPIEDVVVVQYHVEVASASPTLPAWWSLNNQNGCRPFSIGFDGSVPPGTVNCTDWVDGQFGDVWTDQNYTLPANSALLLGGEVARVGDLKDLVPGVEYFIATIRLNHTKTVGDGACAGCTTPVCLLLSDVMIGTVPTSRIWLTQGANWSGSAIASWQNSYITASDPPTYDATGAYSPGAITGCVPYSTTQAKASTWGAVKSLYR